MQDTMPERTAGPLGLARETARKLPCECGAWPGYTCDGKGGMHLARFVYARRIGHLDAGRMAAVLRLALAGGVFTPDTIIPGGAR